jgi:hypothetical protein
MFRRRELRFAVVLYSLAVAASFLLAASTYASLRFHTRDYAFYAQFAAKLLDSQAKSSYSLNPEGSNWLGARGIEGQKSLHQTIHFEPVKYFYAAVYRLTGSTLVLLALIAVAYFLPVIALAGRYAPLDASDAHAGRLLALLYALTPSALFSASYDLRPVVFLAPFFLLGLLAIELDRPRWEQVLWFNALFLAREEAFIAAAVLLLFQWARDRASADAQRTRAWLAASYLAWGVVYAAFVVWTGYPTLAGQLAAAIGMKVRVSPGISSLIAVGLLALFVATGRALRGWLNSGWRQRQDLRLVALSTIALPLGVQFLRLEWPGWADFWPGWFPWALSTPRYGIYSVTLIGLMAVGWRCDVARRFRGGLRPALVSAVVLAAGASLWCYSRAFASCLEDRAPARAVWSLRSSLDRRHTYLMADYATHQAFYDFENVFVVERLPWYLAPNSPRYLPQSRARIVQLLRHRIEVLVCSRDDKDLVEGLLKEARRVHRPIFENRLFVAYRLIGTGKSPAKDRGARVPGRISAPIAVDVH